MQWVQVYNDLKLFAWKWQNYWDYKDYRSDWGFHPIIRRPCEICKIPFNTFIVKLWCEIFSKHLWQIFEIFAKPGNLRNVISTASAMPHTYFSHHTYHTYFSYQPCRTLIFHISDCDLILLMMPNRTFLSSNDSLSSGGTVRRWHKGQILSFFIKQPCCPTICPIMCPILVGNHWDFSGFDLLSRYPWCALQRWTIL